MPQVIPLFLLIIFSFAFPTFAADLCNTAPAALMTAEHIRGLKSKNPVKCVVHDKKQVGNYLSSTIEEKIPDAKLKAEEKLFKALGIIPKSFQYKKGIIDLYLSQLAGYYDPEKDQYVMAGWMPEMMQFPIAVHELTHALQDQHYDLDEYLDPTKLSSDEGMARSALIEGDASLVMYDYMNEQIGKSPLKDQEDISSLVLQMIAGTALSGGFSKAPKSLQAMLLFPYTSGSVFAHSLLRGGGYKNISKAYGRLPKTTKEILHPELYKNAWQQPKINTEKIYKKYGIDAEQISYQDNLGEFIVSTLLNESAPTLAAGLQNDLAIFVEADGVEKIFWITLWDSPEVAGDFLKVYKKNFGKEITKASSDESYVIIEFKR